MKTLRVVKRSGPEAFSKTLEVQQDLLQAKIADRSLDDALVLVEHEKTYTVGRSTPFQQVKAEFAGEVPWVEISRGGGATFHGPGQLVAYPIFDLERHGSDVHLFLRRIEEAGILCLQSFGIQGKTRPGLTGIWVESNTADGLIRWRKIASIGIGVRRWVSCHGIALNISTDLRYFQVISPCGQDGQLATSLEELLGKAPSMEEVRSSLVRSFCQVFGFSFKRSGQKAGTDSPLQRARPAWLKVKAPGSPEYIETKGIVKKHKLHTVCEEAKCPNRGECWSHGTATFMILGDRCTRRCSFCSVQDGTLKDLEPLDPLEPLKVAQAVSRLGLRHVVITSVNRDDLPDMGALHFHRTVKAIAHVNPECDIELLIPDMRGKRDLLEQILESRLIRVLNHNVETVPRLYRSVRPGASFKRSIELLRWVREIQADLRSKSGLMLGLGETKDEVVTVMDELRRADVQVLTLGQYLQPSAKQLPVKRFVSPEEFEDLRQEGLARGFLHVESGPLVRSSYHAWSHTGEQHSLPDKLIASNRSASSEPWGAVEGTST